MLLKWNVLEGREQTTRLKRRMVGRASPLVSILEPKRSMKVHFWCIYTYLDVFGPGTSPVGRAWA